MYFVRYHTKYKFSASQEQFKLWQEWQFKLRELYLVGTYVRRDMSERVHIQPTHYLLISPALCEEGGPVIVP